ncbi:hypothetical protein KEU06_09485 [Pseudaminobacter sp. 19-2017]|uniref:Uncharacterized protein n=1 Tax=Pseudaminobacter soli (ex Zhang et al. 2022) TaxID=2831468 RepID=A0A942E5I1_9HYPH|nr:hypothetical protein [Pseudaminobacter soli]MBS3648837.1 hypothetical protein [Pseudaminobacter soli]
MIVVTKDTELENDLVLKMGQNLDPAVVQAAGSVSAAISLKRIADVLDEFRPALKIANMMVNQMMEEAMKEAADAALNRMSAEITKGGKGESVQAD